MLEFLVMIQNVCNVDERGLLQAYVHKGRLHARQDSYHPPFVNITVNVRFPGPFDEKLLGVSVFDKGHAGFVVFRVDDEFFCHISQVLS